MSVRFDDDMPAPQFSPRQETYPPMEIVPLVFLTTDSGCRVYRGGGLIGLFTSLEQAERTYGPSKKEKS